MAYGLCVQVLIMFMYNMFDFNDKMNEYKISKKAMSFHLRIGINFIQNSCNIYLPGNIPKKMG